MQTVCPYCQEAILIEIEDFGRKRLCPHCQQRIEIPDLTPQRVIPQLTEEIAPSAHGDSKRLVVGGKCVQCGDYVRRRDKVCIKCNPVPMRHLDGSLRRRLRVDDAQPPDREDCAYLAVWLGAFGAHRFYLKQHVLGLLMLVFTLGTCGVGALITIPIGIIEGLRYYHMTDEEFDLQLK